MATLKQGDEYEEEDVGEILDGTASDADDEEQINSKISKKTLYIIGGIAGGIVVIIVIAILLFNGLGSGDADSASNSQTTNNSNFLASILGKTEEEVVEEDDWFFDEDEFEWYFSYTDEEMMRMNALGLTQDEIDEHLFNETPYDMIYYAYVVERARAEQDILDKLNQPDSPEYQKLFNETFLSLPVTTFTVNPGDVPNYTRVETYNCRYEKIKPIYGSEAQIRIDNLYGLVMNVTIPITRYAELEDSGNIVMEISFQDFNEEFLMSDEMDYSKAFVYDVNERRLN